MKKEDFDSKMSSMLEKIGTDSSNLILDDVAILLSDNENMNKEIERKENEIADLKKRNETLQRVNGNLLQQVGMNLDDEEQKKINKKEDEEEKTYFDFRAIFDKNGNFIN